MTNEELAAQIQAGERSMILPLWSQVKGFVRNMAYKWQRRGVEVDDLMQSGFIAMLDALKEWDGDKGAFLTWYALHLKTAFTQTTGQRTERERRDPVHFAYSIDAPLLDDDGDPLYLADVLPDPAAEKALDQVDDMDAWHRLHEAIENALRALTQTQVDIIRARYWRGATAAQAAVVCGLSKEDAQRQEALALRTLRHPKNSKALKEFT